MTFFIAMFVFFMMFIFKYIDDFVGKGLGFAVLSKLFFYFSLTTIPMALPLAILLSSLMTFGNLGEYLELTAMKSAGLSLQKIMTPLIVTTFCFAIGAFYFSNNILPYTNLKAGSLLYDVRESKPALMFKEGVFNNSIDGFSIRVGKKASDGKILKNIMIYDHRAMQGNNIVLSAKEGTMEETSDKMFLVLTLNDGVSYKDIADNSKDAQTHPLIRETFKEKIIRFDLSEFKMSRTNEDLFKSNYQMLNISQLNEAVDTLVKNNTKQKNLFTSQLKKNFYFKTTRVFNDIDSNKIVSKETDFFKKLSKSHQLSVIEAATSATRNSKNYVESVSSDYLNQESSLIKYEVEWHRKFTLSIACIVLFFIGAPLGAIIRKGGLGMPVVVSVIFFIIFHVLSISGEKLAREGEMPAYQGMWLATLVLMPVGIFLTIKATSDSTLFDIDAYINPIKNFFIRKKGS